MATVTDITTTPTSGLNYIDALLDTGPDWNYLPLVNGQPGGNTLYYTFSVTSGNEAGQTGQEAFTLAQQYATRTALDQLSKLTGIKFTEVTNGDSAQIHLCNVDIAQSNVTGLCSWHSTYTYQGNVLGTYDADAYVYLDDVQFFTENHSLTPGGQGYETLLHELGHALGLKHPFFDSTSNEPNQITLPASQDNTSNTLMSYTEAGGPYSTYSQYDVAALKWLYGGDGLGGALGINSTTGARYIAGTSGADTLTGTAANDTLEGDGGNDMMDGGSGTDTAVFRGARSNYTITPLADGDLLVTGPDGVDTLRSVEIMQFDGGVSVTRADVVSAATSPTPPVAATSPATTTSGNLTLMVMTNEHGYTGGSFGNTPQVTGKADAGTTVNIYSADNNQLVGSATPNKYGMYTVDKLSPFTDGMHQVYATETDAAGHVLLTTSPVSFNVDITPPVRPTYSMNYTPGSNQATFDGTAEAGTTIALVRTSDLQQIAHTTVGLDGSWHLQTSPLPNGSYTVSVSSIDYGDNGTNALTSPTWTVNSTANVTGSSGNDTIHAPVGNNAIDGGAGIDTVVYAGSRAGFTVQQADWGFDVTDNGGSNGHDALINVERVQFDDGYVAIDDTAASLYRLYSVAFGRPSDATGMGYWISRMDNGTDLKQVSREFMVGGDGTGQAEFVKIYGANPTDTDFVNQLYHNVLGRDPDAQGFDFWMSALTNVSTDNKVAMRAQLLINFSDSAENIAKVVGSLEHGVDYIPPHV
jgi:hypothetical protein